MYGRIFESIFDSSIMEEGVHVRYLWHCILVLSNKEGVVDLTRQALARRVNLPLTQVNEALECLLSPDPSSRSPLEEGRRLVPIRETDWGWRIVNFEGYRDVRNPEDRRTYMRQYMRGRRQKEAACKPEKLTCKQPSTVLAPASASASASTATTAKEEGAPSSPDAAPPRSPRRKFSKVKGAALPEIPAALDAPEFRRVWDDRVEERSQRGAADRLRPAQAKAQLEKLARVAIDYGIEVAIGFVERATQGGYRQVVFDDALPAYRLGELEAQLDAIRSGDGRAADRGPMPSPDDLPADRLERWEAAVSGLRLPKEDLATWFRPLGVAWNGNGVHVYAPSDRFRESFEEHYSTALSAALGEEIYVERW